jgi:hypothetical protein
LKVKERKIFDYKLDRVKCQLKPPRRPSTLFLFPNGTNAMTKKCISTVNRREYKSQPRCSPMSKAQSASSCQDATEASVWFVSNNCHPDYYWSLVHSKSTVCPSKESTRAM